MEKHIKEPKEPELSLEDLTGMQSVRVTFTLPAKTIDLVSAVANQLGIKQKSIFDHLTEDRHVLDKIAREAVKTDHKNSRRRQKTFVISRNCLRNIDNTAKKYRLPRDILVEFSLRRLRPVIDAARQKQKNKKILLNEMQDFLDLGYKMMVKARKMLGENDAMYLKLKNIVCLFEKNINEFKSDIEKGENMEKFS